MVGLVVAGLLGYWGYGQAQARERLATQMANNYQRSFFELVENVEQVQVLLGKALASTSDGERILHLTDVWNHANTAQTELNRLPLAAQTVYDTSKFLSQTGDFSHVIARGLANGEEFSQDDRDILRQLREHAIQVTESLYQVMEQVMSGEINWNEMVRETRDALKEEERPENPEERTEAFDMDGSFNDIRDEMGKVPVLIYDGPFSDHISNREPLGLTGDEITKDDARERVLDYIDVDGNADIDISDGSPVEGRIPAYNFQVQTGNGVYSVDISETGGHLVSLLNNRGVERDGVDMNEAVELARDYLAKIGYPNMEPTYSEIQQNVFYVSFAYETDDVIFYPDLINVQVAMDNGQIIAVEASRFLMGHHDREAEEAEITEEEAEEIANETLDNIDNIRLAVIPKPSTREVFTYEVRGMIGEEVYLIYINALDGNEEQILRVIMGEQGTFAL
ncbi:germination protein YpeB [Natronospora cellulosivora (SeqCode)]